MSNAAPPENVSSPPEPPPPAPPRRGILTALRSLLAPRVLAVIVALALLAAIWVEVRNRGDALQQELARKLAEAQAYNQESRQIATQVRDTVKDIEFKVGMLESKLSETQNQRLALESLYLELSRSRDERILAEVEQILLIGSQQLHLAGNLKSALIALEAADSRLQRADSAQFTALRRAIRSDIDRLKAVPYVDVVGMSVRLDALARQVEVLPLAMEARPTASAQPPARPDEGKAAQLAREFWRDVRGLISIQRIDATDVPLVSPRESFFLRENLRMRLLSARVALLAHDEPSYKADLQAASQWMQTYFAVGDKRVGGGLATLKQLSESELSIDLPDISASLQAVRDAKLVRERGLR